MQITLLTELFRKSINIALKSIADKVINPVLDTVRISAEGSYAIRIESTDVSTWTVVTCPVVSMNGLKMPFLMNAKTVASIMSNMLEDTFTISGTDDEKPVKIKCNGKAKGQLTVPTITDYTQFPDISTEVVIGPRIQIEAQQLTDILMLTSFSIQKDNFNGPLKGLNINLDNSTLNFVGADGNRLSRVSTHIAVDPDNSSYSEILSLNTVNELKEIAKMCKKEDVITLVLGKSLMVTEIESDIKISYYSRYTTDQYPKITQLFTKAETGRLSCDKDFLINSLKLISSNIEVPIVIFTLDKKEVPVLQVSLEDSNMNTIELTDTTYTGDPLVVGFSPKYIVEALDKLKPAHIAVQDIEVIFTGILNPLSIEQSSNNFELVHLIMPMRIN